MSLERRSAEEYDLEHVALTIEPEKEAAGLLPGGRQSASLCTWEIEPCPKLQKRR